MQLVDDLNLKHSIVDDEIPMGNVLMDPESDSIVLIDFDAASRVGVTMKSNNIRDHEGIVESRHDVSGVMVFLYEYIT
jgi:hypothetical protein